MSPVAILRRVGFVSAVVCSLSSFSLAAQASEDQSTPNTEAAFAAGLKPAARFHFADGVFKNDVAPSEVSVEAPLEAPAVPKNDYSLSGARASNGGLVLEQGMASWYGKVFHGRKTSSGDPFDMYAMTAAHPSLPIPSYIRVTNLANGRSVVVRVNDRGPYHPGRILDLSYAAAYKLGYAEQGHANVEVALVLPEEVAFVQPNRPVPPIRRAKGAAATAVAAARNVAPAPLVARAEETPPQSVQAAESAAPVVATLAASVPAAPVTPAATGLIASTKGMGKAGEFFLQLGTFGTFGMADNFKGFVEHELKSLKETVSVLSRDGKYRLRVGPFNSAFEASSMAERIANTLKLKPSVVQR